MVLRFRAAARRFKVLGSGFGVLGSSLGLRFAVLARRLRKVWGLGFGVQGARRRVQASRVQASGFAGRLFKVQSAVLAVQGLGFGVWG